MSALQKLMNQETRLLLWLNGKSQRPFFAKCVRMISHCGDGHLYILIGILAIWFKGSLGQSFVLSGFIAYLIELSLYFVLKNTIRRARPCHGIQNLDALICPSDQFSFPSGHTAAACVFATLVVVFFPAFSSIAFIGALMIGFSRVMLGVHYPSDILAGAILGISSAVIALVLADIYHF